MLSFVWSKFCNGSPVTHSKIRKFISLQKVLCDLVTFLTSSPWNHSFAHSVLALFASCGSLNMLGMLPPQGFCTSILCLEYFTPLRFFMVCSLISLISFTNTNFSISPSLTTVFREWQSFPSLVPLISLPCFTFLHHIPHAHGTPPQFCDATLQGPQSQEFIFIFCCSCLMEYLIECLKH